MAFFPLFIDLDDFPCLVVGGGKVALRKVNILKEYGAKVTVVAPETEPALENLEEIEIRKRKFHAGDLDGMRIVFVTTSDGACNRYVAGLCKERKIPVNVADVPEECDFFFPALVHRGDVVVGISTGGKSPAAAKKIKERIDSCLPQSLTDFVKEAGIMRTAIKDSGQPVEENERYMGQINAYFKRTETGRREQE